MRAAQADALVSASQRKLELWGINKEQIDAPEAGGVPHTTLYASASGSVVERKVTQGQYVNAGDTLFHGRRPQPGVDQGGCL
jgi:multidrug resistance efflux pump